MSDTTQQALQELQSKTGQEIHCSDWLEVSQDLVNRFADATGDYQWIHVDPARAESESPYGGTIAHGYLTLSLYPMLRGLVEADKPIVPGVRNVINYGLNKLRFPNAVRVGSRIRGRCTLVSVEEIKGSLQITEQYAVEIEGEERPACVAECVMRLYF
jgi:acyl dehydratase